MSSTPVKKRSTVSSIKVSSPSAFKRIHYLYLSLGVALLVATGSALDGIKVRSARV